MHPKFSPPPPPPRVHSLSPAVARRARAPSPASWPRRSPACCSPSPASPPARSCCRALPRSRSNRADARRRGSCGLRRAGHGRDLRARNNRPVRNAEVIDSTPPPVRSAPFDEPPVSPRLPSETGPYALSRAIDRDIDARLAPGEHPRLADRRRRRIPPPRPPRPRRQDPDARAGRRLPGRRRPDQAEQAHRRAAGPARSSASTSPGSGPTPWSSATSTTTRVSTPPPFKTWLAGQLQRATSAGTASSATWSPPAGRSRSPADVLRPGPPGQPPGLARRSWSARSATCSWASRSSVPSATSTPSTTSGA